jgi:hypothetical protein
MEPNMVTLLKTVCARVHPDIAPENTLKPFITWRALGGESARFLDNSAASKRNTLMQIDVWSTTRAETLTMVRQVEDALCGSSLFVAQPMGEAFSDYEDDTQLYGSTQRFSIWADR